MKLLQLLLLSCLFCSYVQASLENVYRLQHLLREDGENIAHKINQLDDPLPSMMTAVVLLNDEYITPEEYSTHIGEDYFIELVEVIRTMNFWLKGLVYINGETAAYFRRLSISRIAFRQTAYALMSSIYRRHLMFLIKDDPIQSRFDEYQQFVSQSITNYYVAPSAVYPLSGDDDSDDPNYGEDELVINLNDDIGVQIAHLNEAIGTLRYTAKRLELQLGIPEDVSPMESFQLANNLIMTMDCIIRGSSNSFDTENYNHLFVQTGGLTLLEDFQNIPIPELNNLQQYVEVMIDALERGHRTMSDQRFWVQQVFIMFPQATNFEEVQQVYPRQEDLMEEEFQ